jgi:hypothetical protein
MKRLIGLLLLAGILASAPTFAMARGLEEFYIYPFVEYFNWKEFSGGERLLEESGPLGGVGAAASIDLYNKALILKGKADIFGGLINYDGQTQGGTPITTDTDYIGSRLEADAGWRINFERASLEPFAGLGYKWWRRHIQDTTTPSGQPVSGYPEIWQTVYVKAGVRGDVVFNQETRFFYEAGEKYPFYTSNEADFPGVGKTTVEPKGDPAAFAELGIRYKWFRPSIFYEGYHWSASDRVLVTDNAGTRFFLSQPESESYIIGFNLGIAFR